jgi:uncharacterized protein
MAEREVDIEWAEGRSVPGILEGPNDSAVGVVLAHGAGAGQVHPFISGLRSRLAAAGMIVLTFEYPYMAAGRRSPDRPPVLVECHRAAATLLARRVASLVLAGKSMGGRVGSHVEGFETSRRVFYGYPLVPIGKDRPRDTEHLDRIEAPMLFVQGERDRMAPLDLLRPVVDRLGATLEVIPGADHSFRVPKSVGITEEEMLDRLAAITEDWLAQGSSRRSSSRSFS